jgi:hypothetical protein
MRAESFATTSGVIVPVDADMLVGVIAAPPVSRHAEPARVADDPRLVTPICRAAVECGIMARVAVE